MQVVPNVKSRDQLGKTGSSTLLQYFTATFGAPDIQAFKNAQACFVQSLAAYGIVCYLLAIKVLHL